MQTELETPARMGSPLRVYAVPLLLVGFTIFYFADVLLRASEKYFWYDEIFTLYLARLSPGALWRALQIAIDFNPPLFYWLTQASKAVLGENRIGLRLPEIVGFWVLCLCLFRFVSRRAGVVPGFIAMVFPLFTGAFYYAYEARPHAIVLGFAGLSIVCWQMADEGNRRRLSLTLLSLSLFGAFMSHCYALLLAFPFAIAQLYQTVRTSRLHLDNWLAILVPAIAAIPIYLPLLRSEHKLSQGTQFNQAFAPHWNRIWHFYTFILSPSILLLLLALLLLSMAHFSNSHPRLAIRGEQILLALGFLIIPALGVILGKVVDGPFFDRYFLSALIGICFFLAILFDSPKCTPRHRIGVAYAALLAVTLIYGFTRVVWDRLHQVGEMVREPSVGETLDTTPHNAMANESLLVSAPKDIPIGIHDSLQFIYISHYSPEVSRRLYYLARSNNDPLYRTFPSWGPLGPRCNPPQLYGAFLDSHPRCYLYGGNEVFQDISELITTGWQLRSLRMFNGHNLALVEKTATIAALRSSITTCAGCLRQLGLTAAPLPAVSVAPAKPGPPAAT